MSRLNTEAYRQALHALVRQKKFIFAILISLLPLAAGWLMFFEDKYNAQDADRGSDPEYSWNPGFTLLAGRVIITVAVPLMCLLLAGGLLADEVEERTLSYLLVRPVPRTTLYGSRALAVLTVAAPLAVLQVFGLWIIRWVSYGIYAETGARVQVDATHSVTALSLLWTMLPAVLGVALLATLFYAMLFGMVSLVTTRYHFFLNLGYLGLWEGMLGHIPAGAQRLTATHHFASLLENADQSAHLIFGALTTTPWLSIPLMLALAAVAVAASLVIVKQRDFHVTSAAT